MNRSVILLLAAGAAGSLWAAVPVVSGVEMSQAENRRVTISYSLSGAPAVVTVDIQTNCVTESGTVWTSIGGKSIVGDGGRGCPQGDVFKRVSTDGRHTITWRPDLSWPDHIVDSPNARAVVTAWAPESTPDYLVVDLAGANAGKAAYYPAEDFLPGGLFDKTEYRTTKMVMRRIPAKDVTWTMGSQNAEPGRSDNEKSHDVTLDHDYYIGVFPLTQAQWQNITGSTRTGFYSTDGATRPMETLMCYYDLRENSVGQTTGQVAYRYPAAPFPGSVLGMLRNCTKNAGFEIDFDLPGEAEWEFAARGGVGVGYWPNGKLITSSDNDPNFTGRNKYTGGFHWNGAEYVSPSDYVGPEEGTATVGTSGDRNGFGLYDMCGNVAELCLDYWKKDISALNGAIVTTENGSGLVAEGDDYYHVWKGGNYTKGATECRPAYRGVYVSSGQGGKWRANGARFVCRAGLE